MAFAQNPSYVSSLAASGTGSGTLASPWNVEDVLIGANPKAMAAGDTLCFINDGTYNLTASGNLTAQVGGSAALWCSYVGVDAAGAILPIGTRAVINGASLSSGSVWTNANRINQLVWGLRFASAPSHGVSHGAGTSNFYLNCAANANTGSGISVYNTTYAPIVAYGAFYDNGQAGIDFFSGGLGGLAFENELYGNLIGSDSNGASSAPHIQNICYNNSQDGMLLGLPSPAFNNTLRATALDLATEGLTNPSVALNNIMAGYKKTGATGLGMRINVVSLINGGNLYYDNDTHRGGSVGAPKWQLEGSIQVLDPSFASATDSTPAANLHGYAKPEKVGQEANWKIPGTVQTGAATAGGSGGRRPRIRLHGA